RKLDDFRRVTKRMQHRGSIVEPKGFRPQVRRRGDASKSCTNCGRSSAALRGVLFIGRFNGLLPVPQKPIQLGDWKEQVSRRSVWPKQAPPNQPMQSWDGNAAEIGARLRLFERAKRAGFRVCQSIFLHG